MEFDIIKDCFNTILLIGIFIGFNLGGSFMLFFESILSFKLDKFKVKYDEVLK